MQLINIYCLCPVILRYAKQKTPSESFGLQTGSVILYWYLGPAGWMMLVLQWDSWCGSQTVAPVSLTLLGPIYKRSRPR